MDDLTKTLEDIEQYIMAESPQPMKFSSTVTQYFNLCEDYRKNLYNTNLDDTVDYLKKNYASQIGNIKTALNKRENHLNNLLNIKDESKDMLEMKHFLHSLYSKLDEPRSKYGDDVLQISENILNSYDEVYQIISCVDYGIYRRVVIQFLVDGKLNTKFPVHIDVDMDIAEVINIETNIYPDSSKLLKWFDKHNNDIHELLTRLYRTLLLRSVKNNRLKHSKHSKCI